MEPDEACVASLRGHRIEFEVRAGKPLTLQASAGAAVFPHDGASYEALLAFADHAMYRDKAGRRGQDKAPAVPIEAEFTADMPAADPKPAVPRLNPQLSTP